MILPVVAAVVVVGLVVEVAVLCWLDRRAVRREAEFWEELRGEALEDYGQVFDR